MSKTGFDKLNQERKKRGGELFANPPHTAARSILQFGRGVTGARKLDSFMYDIALFENTFSPVSQEEELELLRQLGFKVNPHFKRLGDIEKVIKYWTLWEGRKEKEDYLVDGIV